MEAIPAPPHFHNLSSNVAEHDYGEETSETLKNTEEDFLKNISDISDFKYSDYNTKYTDLSDFNLAYFTLKTNKDNIRLEFLKQFYLEVDMYIQTNHELNGNFLDHEFTFNNRYILSSSGDNFVKNDKYIPVKYKLNRDTDYITIVNMSIINTSDTPGTCQVVPPVTISESANAANLSFNKLIELAAGDSTDNSIYTNIDIYKDLDAHREDDWKINRFAFVEYFYKNIIVQKNIYSDILTWLEDIQIPEFANFKRALTAKFNKVLNDHLTVFQYIDNYITNNISANDTHNSTSKFKDIIDKTIELKNINNNLNDKTKNIKNMNIKVEKQQKNLSKINIVLIFAIIIFIFLVICLVLHNYINNKTIYILSGIILLFALIIYIYIYNLKTTAYYIAENFTEPSNSITIDERIQQLNTLRDNIKTNAKKLQNSYYNVINPLLNIELKKFREKNDNTKLYDKIASFNVNIGQGDIKFSIETIQYLITISILFVLILLLIKITNRYYYYLIIMISFVIFIILTLIYFVKIVRVVRTKSNNYYLDKPKSQKK
mgnify:CR=1 FL=1|tara:strand:+ start:2364 stop:4001 length:1638 start_codon:yes stop_codon:yes gene_type:complete